MLLAFVKGNGVKYEMGVSSIHIWEKERGKNESFIGKGWDSIKKVIVSDYSQNEKMSSYLRHFSLNMIFSIE